MINVNMSLNLFHNLPKESVFPWDLLSFERAKTAIWQFTMFPELMTTRNLGHTFFAMMKNFMWLMRRMLRCCRMVHASFTAWDATKNLQMIPCSLTSNFPMCPVHPKKHQELLQKVTSNQHKLQIYTTEDDVPFWFCIESTDPESPCSLTNDNYSKCCGNEFKMHFGHCDDEIMEEDKLMQGAKNFPLQHFKQEDKIMTHLSRVTH